MEDWVNDNKEIKNIRYLGKRNKNIKVSIILYYNKSFKSRPEYFRNLIIDKNILKTRVRTE